MLGFLDSLGAELWKRFTKPKEECDLEGKVHVQRYDLPDEDPLLLAFVVVSGHRYFINESDVPTGYGLQSNRKSRIKSLRGRKIRFDSRQDDQEFCMCAVNIRLVD